MVDQTVRATRLVVGFFKLHGNCTLEEMMLESRQLDALEEEVAMENDLAITFDRRVDSDDRRTTKLKKREDFDFL